MLVLQMVCLSQAASSLILQKLLLCGGQMVHDKPSSVLGAV